MLLGEERGAVGHRCSNLQGAGIDFQDLALIFEVVKDVSVAVSGREFWSSAQLDGAHHFPSRRISYLELQKTASRRLLSSIR